MPENKPYALENAINSLQSTNGQQNEQIIKQGSEGLRNDASLHKTMKEVLAEFRGSRGDNEEARRDGNKKSGGATPAPSGGATPEIEGAFSGLGSLATIGIAFAGFVNGLVQGWFGVIKDLGKVVKGTFNFFGNTMKKIITSLGSVIRLGIDKALGSNVMKKMTEGFNKLKGSLSAWFSEKFAFPKFTKFLNSFKLGVDGKAVVNTNSFVKKLLSIRTAVTGFFTSIGGFFTKIGGKITAFKDAIMKPVKGIALGILTTVENLKDSFKSSKIVAQFGKIKTAVTGFFAMIGGKITALKDAIMKPFKAIGDAFSKAKTALFGASDTSKTLKDTTSKMGGVITKMKAIAPSLFRAFTALGKILGWPLTIAIGIYAGIKASIDKFKSGDIIGGVMSFLTAGLNAAIFSVVDILKDGLSWVVGMLGGDKISAFLDSFTFEEMFSSIMVEIEDFIRRPGEKLGEMMDAAKAWWEGFDFMESVKDIGAMLSGLIDDAIEWIKGKLPSIDMVTGFFGKLNPFSSDEEVPVAPETTPVATPTAAAASTQEVDAETIKVMKTVAKAETNPKKPVDAETMAFIKDQDDPAYIAKQKTKAEKRAKAKADMDLRAEERLLRDEEKLRKIKSTGKYKGMDLEESGAYGQRILSNTDNKLAKIETIKKNRGMDVDNMSRENARSSGRNAVTVVAPSSQNMTTNNNQSTAAIMPQNQPTVDQNDRTYHYAM